jgi:ABC-2 type transport system permease protein
VRSGPVRLVARREFVERIRDRGFLISTGITLTILVVFVAASALMARTASFDLAVAGPGSWAVAERVVAQAAAADVEVRIRPVATAEEAERAVRAGEADAALVDAERIVVLDEPPGDLVRWIQATSAIARSRSALEAAGLSPDAIVRALDQPPLPVAALEPLDRRQREYAAIGFVGVLALYGQLFAYGYWVAAGVVEEKSSRVVEVLLATLRPSQLLRGKILGIGLLGLVQLSLIGAVGFAATQVLGALRFPAGALVVIGVVLFWFVLGYFFYASLFAVAGAVVPRQEDLQSTMTPLSIVIIVSFFLGIQANQDPDSLLAVAASFFPPSAPLVMPSRLILGEASVWEALLSVAISVAATLALVPVATKVYARAVLRPGKVKVRQVLRERGTAV